MVTQHLPLDVVRSRSQLNEVMVRKIVAWMTDVLYVPELTSNPFSVHAATSKSNTVLFGHTDCCIKNKLGKVIATGSPSGKLYLLDCELHQMPTENATVARRPSIRD